MTEAVRIVVHVARGAQVSAGGVCDLVYHGAWCPEYCRPLPTGRVAADGEGRNHTKASEHGWRIMALVIMPDYKDLFMNAHRPDCPSLLADLFKGFTFRRLRAEFPHLRSRPSALWSRPHSAATVGAVPAEAVCRYIDRHNERPWRKERPR